MESLMKNTDSQIATKHSYKFFNILPTRKWYLRPLHLIPVDQGWQMGWNKETQVSSYSEWKWLPVMSKVRSEKTLP